MRLRVTIMQVNSTNDCRDPQAVRLAGNMSIPARVWAEIAQANRTPSLSAFFKLTNTLSKTSIIITHSSLHTSYLRHALLLLLHPTRFQPKYSNEARDSYWWVNIDETVTTGLPSKSSIDVNRFPWFQWKSWILNFLNLKTIYEYSEI